MNVLGPKSEEKLGGYRKGKYINILLQAFAETPATGMSRLTRAPGASDGAREGGIGKPQNYTQNTAVRSPGPSLGLPHPQTLDPRSGPKPAKFNLLIVPSELPASSPSRQHGITMLPRFNCHHLTLMNQRRVRSTVLERGRSKTKEAVVS